MNTDKLAYALSPALLLRIHGRATRNPRLTAEAVDGWYARAGNDGARAAISDSLHDVAHRDRLHPRVTVAGKTAAADLARISRLRPRRSGEYSQRGEATYRNFRSVIFRRQHHEARAKRT